MSSPADRKQKLIRALDGFRDSDEEPTYAHMLDWLRDELGITISLEDVRAYVEGDLDEDKIIEGEREWTFVRAE